MWNWKTVYEDEDYAFYCDVDQIVDTIGDGEGTFASTECYMPIPERFAVWTSLFPKNRAARKDYIDSRKKTGLSTTGYKNYRYTLCLVEFDSLQRKYRTIPAADYDGDDKQIGDSSLLDCSPTLVKLSDKWTSIRSKDTHSMMRALFKIVAQ
ncbi:MAG TPA: hypothetical protein VHO84_01415 [Syntrophorhabdaceae bacterium]|nr:hypothetical protein [Syntrophorhabdaceae bacterium]